jgi:hypothetical protein
MNGTEEVMVHRQFVVVFLLGMLSLSSPSWAETLAEQNEETRITVALRVPQSEAQKLLPTPWQVNPLASGPSKDANFLLIFRDRALNLDAAGKPVEGGRERGVVIIVPAKHARTGEIALHVVRVFTANAKFLPGAYKNSALATVRWEQCIKASNLDSWSGAEVWEIGDKAGGIIKFSVEYQRAVPTQSKSEYKIYGGPDPNFFRIYRVDQGAAVVKSVPANVDRAKNYKLLVTMEELRKLFDGSEQLVSITVIPWYMRQVFLP